MTTSTQPDTAAQRVARIVFAMLFAMRLLVPTEATSAGDTLWIAQLTLIAAFGWSLWRIRSWAEFRFVLADAAIVLLVGGHVVGAMAVELGVGNARLALNVMWEWVALGALWSMARVLFHPGEYLRQFLTAMLALAIALTGLGFYQHFVFYRQAGPEFARQLSELDRLENSPQRSANEEARLHELRDQWNGRNLPADSSGRKQLIQRLEASSEPFGPFALANSFGGCLLVWLVIALAWLISSVAARTNTSVNSRPSVKAVFVLVLATCCLGYCLVLTKSRTAYFGLATGTVAAVILGRFQLRSLLLWLGALGVVASMALAIATASGGLDAEVLSEAPKSLQYRLQYWQGTAGVLTDDPLIGAPGNFRRRYLKHKLAESSEEISDPHNFLLDVWANGGLLAFAGILFLIFATMRANSRHEDLWNAAKGEPPSQRISISRDIATGVSLAFLMVTLHDWYFANGTEFRNVVLLCGFLLANRILKACSGIAFPRGAIPGAIVGLLTHLLGAGGIEMPAISQLLLVLVAAHVTCEPYADRQPIPARPPVWRRLLPATAALAMGIAAVACLLTATKPTLLSRFYVAAGQGFARLGNVEQARRSLTLATESDTRSPVAWMQLGNLALTEYHSTNRTESFEDALKSFAEALQRDPQSQGAFQGLGSTWLLRSIASDEPAAAAKAVEFLRSAIALYPTDPAAQAGLAATAHRAHDFDTARIAASEAIRLDEINRAWGHADRYLGERDLASMRLLLSEPAPTDE